ncbi:hypothetical protein [Actinoplanes sp. NPDC051851]|uniref:hypothetical protein n=1 Tax=Actinoplanes sp. NPDC051851 TaxID=3154753 RepID=UPI003436A001
MILDEEIPDSPPELRNAVACELYAQLALRNETIDLEAVPGVADAIAHRIAQSFHADWSPPWSTDPIDTEPIGSEAAVFHASALPPSTERYPVFDRPAPTPGR